MTGNPLNGQTGSNPLAERVHGFSKWVALEPPHLDGRVAGHGLGVEGIDCGSSPTADYNALVPSRKSCVLVQLNAADRDDVIGGGDLRMNPARYALHLAEMYAFIGYVVHHRPGGGFSHGLEFVVRHRSVEAEANDDGGGSCEPLVECA